MKKCKSCGLTVCPASCPFSHKLTTAQRKARKSDPVYVRELNKAIWEGRALPVSFDDEGAIQ